MPSGRDCREIESKKRVKWRRPWERIVKHQRDIIKASAKGRILNREDINILVCCDLESKEFSYFKDPMAVFRNCTYDIDLHNATLRYYKYHPIRDMWYSEISYRYCTPPTTWTGVYLYNRTQIPEENSNECYFHDNEY